MTSLHGFETSESDKEKKNDKTRGRAPLVLDVVTCQFLQNSYSVLPNKVLLDHLIELRGQHGLHVVDAIRHDDAIAVRR